MLQPIRAAIFTCALAVAALPTAVAAQALSSTQSGAQDPSLIGRPNPESPDACAALPLEWRLRCYGGPSHSVRDIGAPYSPLPSQQDAPVPHGQPHGQPHSQPAWAPQWQSTDAPCAASVPTSLSSQSPQ